MGQNFWRLGLVEAKIGIVSLKNIGNNFNPYFSVSETDDLMKNLLRIAKNVHDYPHRQQKKLIMARNDYMIEEENSKFFQVEFNLIASSLGPICQGARTVHTQINQMLKSEDSNNPENLNLNTEAFVDAFKAAHKAYGVKDAIIVNVNEYGTNLFDQMFPVDDLLAEG